MKYRLQYASALILAWLPAYADTVTKKDHLSVNGTVTTMTINEITLIARYKEGEKSLPLKLGDVSIIEFNDTTFNSGPPPTSLGIGPPIKNASATTAVSPRKAPDSDVVILKGGKVQPGCKLLGIDAQIVRCSGQVFDRSKVLRILVLVPH